MKYVLRKKFHGNYLECEPQGGVIQTEADALDLIAAWDKHETYNLLIHPETFPKLFMICAQGLPGPFCLNSATTTSG